MLDSKKTCYIIGVPRSGTTWLLTLLTKHHQVVGLQQSGLFHALSPLKKWSESNHGFGKKLLSTTHIESEEQFVGDVLSQTEFVRLLRPLVRHIHTELLNSKAESAILVDQTPENLELYELILDLDPDAHFLHIVRDPRAACSSMLGANKLWSAKFPRRVSRISAVWEDYMCRWEDLKSRTDNAFEVRYEDLLQSGPASLHAIYQWLGLKADSALCKSAIADCTIDKLRAQNLGPKGFFRSGKADTWKNDLSARQIRCVDYLCREHLTTKGYRAISGSSSKPMSLSIEQSLDTIFGPGRRAAGSVRRRIRSAK